MAKGIDITGQVFGKLQVIERGMKNVHGALRWWCSCSCGERLLVTGVALRRGQKQCRRCADKNRIVDLTSQQFGKLTVLERGPNNGGGAPRWWCSCSCGERLLIAAKDLKKRRQKQCLRCINKAKINDLAGQHFGRLTVLKRVSNQYHTEKKPQGEISWACRCQCGKIAVVTTQGLVTGNTKSCGCYKSEATAARNEKHGCSGTPEHQIWNGMKNRCFAVKGKNHRYYGRRGVVICEGWHNDFLAFLDDVGKRPSLEHSIDRVDTNGHYSCGHCPQCFAEGWSMNVRWATQKEQMNNTQRSLYIKDAYDLKGNFLAISNYAEQLGILYASAYWRLKKADRLAYLYPREGR